MSNSHCNEDENIFWWDTELTLSSVVLHTSASTTKNEDDDLSSVEALRQQIESWENALTEKLAPLLHTAVNEIRIANQDSSTISASRSTKPAVLSIIELATGEECVEKAKGIERASSWFVNFFANQIPVLADLVKAAVEESSPSLPSNDVLSGAPNGGASVAVSPSLSVQSSFVLQRLCLVTSLQCFSRMLDKELPSGAQSFSIGKKEDIETARQYLSQTLLDVLFLSLVSYYVALDKKKFIISSEPTFSFSARTQEGEEEPDRSLGKLNALSPEKEDDACRRPLYFHARLLGRQIAEISHHLDQIEEREKHQRPQEENSSEGNVSAEKGAEDARSKVPTISTTGSSSSSQWIRRSPSMAEAFLQHLPQLWSEIMRKYHSVGGTPHPESRLQDGSAPYTVLCAAVPLARQLARSAMTHFFSTFVDGYRRDCGSVSYPNASAVLHAIRAGMLKNADGCSSANFTTSSGPSSPSPGRFPPSLTSKVVPSIVLKEMIQENWSSIEMIQLLAQCYDPFCAQSSVGGFIPEDDNVWTALRWLLNISEFLRNTLATAEYNDLASEQLRMQSDSGGSDRALSRSSHRRKNSAGNSKFVDLRDASISLSEVLISPLVHPSLSVLLFPYYVMISNVFYAERRSNDRPKSNETSTQETGATPKGQETLSSCAFSNRFMDFFLEGTFQSTANSVLFKQCAKEGDELLKQQLKSACESTSSQNSNPSTPGGPSSQAANTKISSTWNYLPLGLTFLMQPVAVLQKLIMLAQQSPLTPDTLSLEDEIRKSNKPSPIITDQRLQSVQRDEAYRGMSSLLQQRAAGGPPTTSDTSAPTISKIDLVARVFHPRYYTVFSALYEAVKNVSRWISAQPHFLTVAQLMGISHLDSFSSLSALPSHVGDGSPDEVIKQSRDNFTKLLNHYLSSLLDRVIYKVVRPTLRVMEDPAAALVHTEFYMFCTLLTSDAFGEVERTSENPVQEYGLISEQSSNSRIGFLRSILQQFFSWKDSSLLSSTSKCSSHFVYLLHRRIVQEQGYTYASFFIPSLRAAGVDDSMVDELADMMRVAHIPYRTYGSAGTSPFSTDAPPSAPRMGAELVFVRELPCAGYCSSGVAPLSERLKDDAVLWWDRLLFSAFKDDDEMVEIAISELDSFLKEERVGSRLPHSPGDRGDRTSAQRVEQEREEHAKDAFAKRPREEENHTVNEEEGLTKKAVKRELTTGPPTADEPSPSRGEQGSMRLAYTVRWMLEILIDVGTIVVQRILSIQRGTHIAKEKMHCKLSRPPMVLEADVLKAFFTGWWRLCDEMCFPSNILEKNDRHAFDALFQCRQRAKFVVMKAIASRFGITSVPSFSLSNLQWTPDVTFTQFLTFIMMHLEMSPKSGLERGSGDRESSMGWSLMPAGADSGIAVAARSHLRHWVTTLEYEDVEYQEIEKMVCPGVPASRGGGPRGILRQCNFDYGNALETAILQRRRLFTFYLEWKAKHKPSYLASMRKALEADGKLTMSNTPSDASTPPSLNRGVADEKGKTTDSTAQNPNAYLTDINRFIRLRVMISPVEAAGAAGAYRQLLLYSTGVLSIPSAGQDSVPLPPNCSWLTPLLAIEFCSKLVYAICRQLQMESAPVSASAASANGNSTGNAATTSLPMTLSELTGATILLRVLWDTLVEVQKHLEGKQGVTPRDNTSSVLSSVASAQRHLLQDLTSAMKQMILANRTKTDAAVLLLAKHFTSALANSVGYLAVVEQARKRLNSLKGGHHTPALQELLALAIPLPETAHSSSSSHHHSESSPSSSASDRKRRRSGKPRSGGRGSASEENDGRRVGEDEGNRRGGEDRREADEDRDRKRDRHRRRRSSSRDRQSSGPGGGEDRRREDVEKNASSRSEGEGRRRITFADDVDYNSRTSSRVGGRRSSNRHGHGSRNKSRR